MKAIISEPKRCRSRQSTIWIEATLRIGPMSANNLGNASSQPQDLDGRWVFVNRRYSFLDDSASKRAPSTTKTVSAKKRKDKKSMSISVL